MSCGAAIFLRTLYRAAMFAGFLVDSVEVEVQPPSSQ
jgi:hypothetical protein